MRWEKTKPAAIRMQAADPWTEHEGEERGCPRFDIAHAPVKCGLTLAGRNAQKRPGITARPSAFACAEINTDTSPA